MKSLSERGSWASVCPRFILLCKPPSKGRGSLTPEEAGGDKTRHSPYVEMSPGPPTEGHAATHPGKAQNQKENVSVWEKKS